MNTHIANADEMGAEAFETHRECRQRIKYCGISERVTCPCSQCERDYQTLLTASTNYRDHSKQEQKKIRMAIDELV